MRAAIFWWLQRIDAIVVSMHTQTRNAVRVDREAQTEIRSKASSPTR